MKIQFPESSIIRNPHKIEGFMKEAKKSFYELAKNKVKYLSWDEIQKWHKETSDRDKYVTIISYILNCSTNISEEGNCEKWINNLEIVLNIDVFKRDGKKYCDLIPFVLEHDIYEAWLTAKKSTAFSLDVDKKHLLARRREFLLAAKQGLADKLFEFHMLVNPGNEEEYRYALEYARRRTKSICKHDRRYKNKLELT